MESEIDPIVDETCRRILWSHYGLDSYSERVYFELSNKEEYERKYNELKKEFLGPYFKEEDAFKP